MTTKDQLDKLSSQWVIYQNEKLFINSATISSAGIITFKTNKRQFSLPEEYFNIADFQIMEKETENKYLAAPVKPASDVIASTIIGTNASELTTILMDNIKRIQSDAGYIAQAEAINNNVKSIIEVAKAQIDAFKVMKGI